MAKTKPKKQAKRAAAKKAAAKPAKKSIKKAPAEVAAGGEGERLTFNHAMIYSKDVERSLRFYRDLLGFKMVDEFQFEGNTVYARLRAPGGDGTIALHQTESTKSIVSEGVRLYFEIRELDDFCRKLQAKGFYITQLPRMMPWGWRHAYLNDPDGHEISLYWAEGGRMKKTMMKVAKEIAKAPVAKGR